ncbi:MAG: hypothetical protein RBR86_00010 [Pseudobdellovibrionaceae bacterium]|jgi:hypothetical protein|nr:hypothetical protein [Pseudobdellovibrionaceae bacterium]
MSEIEQPKALGKYYLIPKGSNLQKLIDQYRQTILEPFVQKAHDFCEKRGISKLEYHVGQQKLKVTTACFFDLRPQAPEWARSEDGVSLIPRKKSRIARDLSRQFNQIEARSFENFLKAHGIECGKVSFRVLEDGSSILACDRDLNERFIERGVTAVNRAYIYQFHIMVRFQQDWHFTLNDLDKSPFATKGIEAEREQDYKRAFAVACRSGDKEEFPPLKDLSSHEKALDSAMYYAGRWVRQAARLALSLRQRALGRDLA